SGVRALRRKHGRNKQFQRIREIQFAMRVRIRLRKYVVDHFGGSLSQEILLAFLPTIGWTRPQVGRWNISTQKPGTMCDNSHERLLHLWTRSEEHTSELQSR